MGNIIRFEPREETAAQKTARLLTRIGEAYQQRVQAAHQLPEVLAHLVRSGEAELALQAICAWGEGEMEAHEVLAMVKAKRSGMGATGD